MQVRFESVTQAVIRPRMDRIDLMTEAVGCKSDPHRAILFGVSARTISRARTGRGIGADFIANTLAALREHERALLARNLKPSFDELFEVVIEAAAGTASDGPKVTQAEKDARKRAGYARKSTAGKTAWTKAYRERIARRGRGNGADQIGPVEVSDVQSAA